MSEGNKFDYYYGEESQQFAFIRSPKIMLTDPMFEEMTLGSIILFGVLLDRMNLSKEHRWLDEDNRVYIRYKIQEIQKTLNISEKTATTYLNGLEKMGLVEKVKVGLGQGNILYIKNFITPELREKALHTGKNYRNEKSKNDKKYVQRKDIEEKIQKSKASEASKHPIPVENGGNGAVDFGGNGAVEIGGNGTVNFGGHSNTDINNNKYNNNPISSYHDRYFEVYLSRLKRDLPDDGIGWIDESNRAGIFREGIRKQIQYDYLEECEEVDIYRVDDIVEQMVEIMLDDSPKIRISSKELDSDYVKSRMFRINREHINYMLLCLNNTKAKIGNIKSYLRATIFNSLATKGSYFNAEYNSNVHAASG